MNRLSSRKAFTLVELLVVIGIIAVLASLLLPAVRSAIDKAERTQAQTDVKNIKAAIQTYFNDYGKLPSSTQGSDVTLDGDSSKPVFKALTANDPKLNPKNFAYLESQTNSTDGTYRDPWEEQYSVAMDCNYDNKVTYGGDTFTTVAIVTSAGPDGEISKKNDNISSAQ